MATIESAHLPPSVQDGSQAPGGSLAWLKTAALCLVLSVAAAYWIKFVSLVHGTCHVGESVPPVPALSALLFLLALRFVLDRVRLKGWIDERTILSVYVFVTITAMLSSIGAMRIMISYTTAPHYMTGKPAMQEVVKQVPRWFAPASEDVITAMYEGWEGARVPWADWARPLAFWSLTLGVFFLTTMFMVGLFYRRWTADERLRFPLATLALDLAQVHKGAPRTGGSFRDPVFWAGFTLVGIYNLFFILPAIFPSLGAVSAYQQVNLHEYFTTPPWSAGGQWYFRLSPIVFGLGYLVSLDVLFTIWVMVIITKVEAVFLASIGAPEYPLFHMKEQQAVGSYAALALVMIWAARRRMWAALKSLAGRGTRTVEGQRPARWSMLGTVAGTCITVYLFHVAGLAVAFAALLVLWLLISCLVQARIRAQVGVPIIYMRPWDYRSVIYLLGGATLFGWGGARNVAVFAVLCFFLNSCLTALPSYQVDALFLGERSGVKRTSMMLLTFAAVLVGFALTYYIHLTAFYSYGGVNIKLPLGTSVASAYELARQQTKGDTFRLSLVGLGFISTGLIALLRSRFFWLPLHPVGFAVSCAQGSYLFGAIFVIWIIKAAILKWAGGRWYRRLWPFFLGVVIGHFFVAGLLWGGLSITGKQVFERYRVGFW